MYLYVASYSGWKNNNTLFYLCCILFIFGGTKKVSKKFFLKMCLKIRKWIALVLSSHCLRKDHFYAVLFNMKSSKVSFMIIWLHMLRSFKSHSAFVHFSWLLCIRFILDCIFFPSNVLFFCGSAIACIVAFPSHKNSWIQRFDVYPLKKTILPMEDFLVVWDWSVMFAWRGLLSNMDGKC